MSDLFRIVAPRFVAGGIYRDGRCVRAANILNRLSRLEYTVEQVVAWCRQHGYAYERLV